MPGADGQVNRAAWGQHQGEIRFSQFRRPGKLS